jgi:hypothetical protein
MSIEAKPIPEAFLGTAAKLKEAGKNSRQVGAEKTFKALHWVYRWGWSYPFILDQVASPGRRGFTKKLVEQNLLSSFDCPGAGGKKGIPKSVVCLTKDGQMAVESELLEDQFLSQGLEDDIPWHQLYHDAIIQRSTALKDDLAEFRTPKEIADKSAKGVKQADAIWILKTGLRIGIELELTAKKKGREFDQTILALLQSVNPKGNPHSLDMISIIGSAGILQNYKKRLSPGNTIDLWERDQSRRWIESEKKITVPEWASKRFTYIIFKI